MEPNKIRLVAELLKQWPSDPEIRALSEYILDIKDISLVAIQTHTLLEVVDMLSRTLSDENDDNSKDPGEDVNTDPESEFVHIKDPIKRQIKSYKKKSVVQ